MKQQCEIVKARGKDLEPGDVILWQRNDQITYIDRQWREILDIWRAEEDIDAFYSPDWRTRDWQEPLAKQAEEALGDTGYFLARVLIQEKSRDGNIEDEVITLYDYDLYDAQSLNWRKEDAESKEKGE